MLQASRYTCGRDYYQQNKHNIKEFKGSLLPIPTEEVKEVVVKTPIEKKK